MEEMIVPRFRSCPSAFPALGHNGFVQTLAQVVGQLVQFVAAVDLNRLPCRVQRDFAMFAAAEMLLEIDPKRNRRVLIEHVIQLRQKLRACHFAPPWACFDSRLLK
jgi:hypothetical protein